jgi:hypothetical protein
MRLPSSFAHPFLPIATATAICVLLAGCGGSETPEGGRPPVEDYDARSADPGPDGASASDTSAAGAADVGVDYATPTYEAPEPPLTGSSLTEGASGDTLALVEALKMVLGSSTSPLDLHLQLGQVYLKSGQYERAVDEYGEALAIAPTPVSAARAR